MPESGKILIDGVDIATTDPSWLRRQIGVVLQENFLFNASVRDNIAVHVPSSSMDDIVRVAKIAGAHEFITELPNGYDTMVGEKGEGLSGGQKQRIAIARALLHNPKVLIFDEATSALDYESENIIQRNLKQITAGRTVIIIAHRLSTLKSVDKIMAIDRGQLVEYGTCGGRSGGRACGSRRCLKAFTAPTDGWNSRAWMWLPNTLAACAKRPFRKASSCRPGKCWPYRKTTNCGPN